MVAQLVLVQLVWVRIPTGLPFLLCTSRHFSQWRGMQLFILSRSPLESAMSLSDVHLRKMCLETAQILSSVMCRKEIPLRIDMPCPYHLNHPVITAIRTREQINWVASYNEFLHLEYLIRFGKHHAYCRLAEGYTGILYDPSCGCSPEGLARDFKDFQTAEPDLISAHREYYRFKKTIIRNWKFTGTEEPLWLK